MDAAYFYLIFVVALFLVLPILIGVYVYRDANSRGMNAALWTLIAALAPSGIGLIIYLVVRSDYNSLECPNCKAPILEEYSSCPKCGTSLKAKCTNCGKAIASGWQNCAHCGEPVPADAMIPTLPKRKDNGLGKILVAVILIPVLIISTLVFGLASFRSGHPTSVGSVDGMRIEDFAENKVVSDWLKSCDASGTGIYVLEYQYPKDKSSNLNRSNYIVYRTGLSKDVSVAAVGFQNFFKESLRVEYNDSEITGATDYHIYQVDYSTTAKVQLEVLVNGQKADYKLTTSTNPLLFIDPVPWRNGAANLYKLRLDYLGDNSGVSRLVKETGLEFAGDYTLELKTSEKPYGLRVIYTDAIMDFETNIYSPYATELLGLIKNLDYVEITDGESTFRLTADEASQTLGHDVKDFGTDPSKLEAYLKSIYGDNQFDQ
ncbi:DUF4825 domain-containing protein [Proteiniclasticum sp. QWL-01]|uniref:DUF4825 domain-containing protein n=1 Tax=Proteiniclasticum sp. QWL-01 TaxID=3036945 RepID=UPI0024116DAC|nr:DUF4825 domain-containing protein [Proteiniclasticum sp. QWL-01]WFF73483.1 DUF4825 domain-containing protein [Proteiniclasticum sp. QWL-01]